MPFLCDKLFQDLHNFLSHCCVCVLLFRVHNMQYIPMYYNLHVISLDTHIILCTYCGSYKYFKNRILFQVISIVSNFFNFIYLCIFAFRLLNEHDCNIFANMQKTDFREFRNLIIEMVLHTDMSQHFSQLKAIKTMVQQNSNESR